MLEQAMIPFLPLLIELMRFGIVATLFLSVVIGVMHHLTPALPDVRGA
ncbi:MAG TPA: hypothetical protein VFS01_13260 [Rhizomicrobium sp.]|jgi:hypothetical protein|nr:hypothetical protein [Rhizomicrobium sp.]